MVIVVHGNVDDGIGGVVDIVLVVGLGEQQAIVSPFGLVKSLGMERIQTLQGQFILPRYGQGRVDAGKFTQGGRVAATLATSQRQRERKYRKDEIS